MYVYHACRCVSNNHKQILNVFYHTCRIRDGAWSKQTYERCFRACVIHTHDTYTHTWDIHTHMIHTYTWDIHTYMRHTHIHEIYTHTWYIHTHDTYIHMRHTNTWDIHTNMTNISTIRWSNLARHFPFEIDFLTHVTFRNSKNSRVELRKH